MKRAGDSLMMGERLFHGSWAADTLCVAVFFAFWILLGQSALAGVPVSVGPGCTTVYFIDKDCDGYGVGKKAGGVYSMEYAGHNLLDAAWYTMGDLPDADDEDATVSTTAQWQAKWGDNNQGMINFLQQRKGFANTSRIFYVAQSGDNATGMVNDPTHPYRTMAPVMTILQDLRGGAVIIRGGDWTDLDFSPCSYSHGNPCFALSGTSSTPLYIMAYPGERVQTILKFDATGYNPYPNQGYVTFDGLSWLAAQYGGGDAINTAETDHFTYINNEFAGWHQTSFGNHTEDVLIKWNVYHDMQYHTVYFLSSGPDNPNPGVTFDFTSAYALELASFRGQIIQNVMYNNGDSGYEPIHVNTFATGVVVDGNIISYSGGSPIAFQTGVYDSFIKNNVMVANGRSCITFFLYSTSSATIERNTIENNSCYMGAWTDSIRGTSPNGGFTAAVLNANVGFIKNNTVRNNIFVYDNPAGPLPGGTWGAAGLYFDNKSFPETWTIQNNVWNNWDSVASANDRFWHVEGIACPGGTCTPGDFTFAQFSAGHSGNLYADPKFVVASASYTLTPEKFDLRLAADSPAIALGAGAYAAASPPPPPPAGVLPTASITVAPPSIRKGDAAILSWSSTDATSCQGVPLMANPDGWIWVTPRKTTTYTITCAGPGGVSAPASVTLKVAPR